MNPERNDVEVKSLFTWGREFNIVDNNNDVESTLFMRLVGDSDWNRARVFALRKSAEKRHALMDLNSDDRIAFIEEKGVIGKERLVPACVLFSSKELAKEAIREVTIKQPKEPKTTASLKEQEKYQKEVDDYPAKLDKALRDYVTKKIEEKTEEYKLYSEDKLYEMYVNYLIDEICEMEMLNSFKSMCTYLGTYKDSKFKEKYFESYNDFDNLDTNIKQQFISAYESLDITPEELKKLQVATR
jgi:hypothetical protein